MFGLLWKNRKICRKICSVYVMYVYIMLPVKGALCTDTVLHAGVGVQVKSVLDRANLNVR